MRVLELARKVTRMSVEAWTTVCSRCTLTNYKADSVLFLR